MLFACPFFFGVSFRFGGSTAAGLVEGDPILTNVSPPEAPSVLDNALRRQVLMSALMSVFVFGGPRLLHCGV